MKAIENIERELPFKILGFDSDNGNEFINWHLYKYLRRRKKPVSYTRSRAYKKNDNAHIEQKNWTLIRQFLGYQRIESLEAVEMMITLYRNKFTMFQNNFIPSIKLIQKNRVGAKIVKLHDVAKTPYQRVQ